MPSKKVAIIGAGTSGLTAIKCCLDEGLEPVCFEKTSDIGGLWNFRPNSEENVACVMQSTVINTSKEMMSFSDFPIPAESPNFMHHSHILKYFNLYVEEFGLRQYIQQNTEVMRISMAEDNNETGRWEVTTWNQSTDEERQEVFDAVLLSTGHHAKPHVAKFEGEESFRGKRLHTHDYREYPTEFVGQRVLVIGFGNSGLDVAVELSRITKQVFVSTRTGGWIRNRVSVGGLPLDIMFNRRVVHLIRKKLPRFSEWFATYQVNSRFDHALYSVKPAHGIDSQHPTLNDDLPNCIANGSIKIKSNVKRITETGVEFDDGTFEDNIDTIFYATGYVFGFPYLDKRAIDVKENRVKLYKFVFPPDMRHPTLAVLGCIQPLGAIMPISEMQARWATRIFKGDLKLPSADEMHADIRSKAEAMSKLYYASQRHTIQVDYVNYMDELAEMADCAPDIRGLLRSDPRFALKMFFGPCAPYQYRLHGHGRWDGAKEALETLWDRVEKPLKTRKVPKVETSNNAFRAVVLLFIVLPIIVLIVTCYI